VLAVHNQMQAEQAAQAQAQQQQAMAGPGAQPGMAQPGGVPAVGPLPPSQQNLTALLSSLHRQQGASRESGGTGVPANIAAAGV